MFIIKFCRAQSHYYLNELVNKLVLLNEQVPYLLSSSCITKPELVLVHWTSEIISVVHLNNKFHWANGKRYKYSISSIASTFGDNNCHSSIPTASRKSLKLFWLHSSSLFHIHLMSRVRYFHLYSHSIRHAVNTRELTG